MKFSKSKLSSHRRKETKKEKQKNGAIEWNSREKKFITAADEIPFISRLAEVPLAALGLVKLGPLAAGAGAGASQRAVLVCHLDQSNVATALLTTCNTILH